MVTTKTDVQILRDAAAAVRKSWTHGRMFDENGNACAMGTIALQVVDGKVSLHEIRRNNSLFVPALEATFRIGAVVAEALGLEVKPLPMYREAEWPSLAVAAWNDGFRQTAENVAAGLEYAALYLEEKEKNGQQRDASEVGVGAGALAGRA